MSLTLSFQYGPLDRRRYWVASRESVYHQVDSKTLQLLFDLNDRIPSEEIRAASGVETEEIDRLRNWVVQKKLLAPFPETACIEQVSRFRTPIDLGGFLFFLSLLLLIQFLYWVSLAEHLSLASFSQVPPIMGLAFLGIVLHEGGHALALKQYTQPKLRLGWVLFYPVVYIKSEILWQLSPSRRLHVNLMGILADSVFNCLAVLSVLMNPALEPWVTPLLVTQYIRWMILLNPLYQGDGYWLLFDALGKTNIGYQSHVAFAEKRFGALYLYRVTQSVFVLVIWASIFLLVYHLIGGFLPR